MAADDRSIPWIASERISLAAEAARRPGLLGGRRARLEEEAAGPRAAANVARDRRHRRFLLYADLVATLTASVVTVGVAAGARPLWSAVLLLPLVAFAAKIGGLYDRDELRTNKTTLDEAPQLFQLATLVTLILWLGDEMLVDRALLARDVVVVWGGFFAALVAGRCLARALARRTTPVERCLLIGDARAYARLRSKLDGAGGKSELVGRLSLQRVARAGERAVDNAELHELISWTNADRVIIDPHVLPHEDMLDLVRAVKGAGVGASLLPSVLDVVGSTVVFDELDGMTLLGVPRFGLGRSSQVVKRAFDVAGTTLLLLALAPVMALVAAAIKLDSRGPVLFRQARIGRDGRAFHICKFRTMVPDAEDRKHELNDLNECFDGLFKITDDPRITRVGRFLRRTSLDELPQLLNVLLGDMSLVGPRPLVLDEDERITGWDRSRLALTPGMTGRWQIAGSSRVPMHEMVKMDYLYVAGWSLWEDVKILLRTVPYMLSRRGR